MVVGALKVNCIAIVGCAFEVGTHKASADIESDAWFCCVCRHTVALLL